MFEYLVLCGDGISFLNLRFENDVKMYGTQTAINNNTLALQFENDVKMYGTQTHALGFIINPCLRMM